MKLSSPSFADGAAIPNRHTCKGENRSPALAWDGVPPGAAAFALLVTDPDAPGGEFLHWLVYNLPAACRGLDEGQPNNFKLSNGAVQGINDFGRPGYGGPCPPPGPAHRYIFQVFALSAPLAPRSIQRAADLLRAMDGKVVGRGTLTGTFRR